MQEVEQWKVYPWDPRYDVSDMGRVRRSSTKRLRRTSIKNGRVVLTFSMPDKSPHVQRYVHKMVLETWVGACPPGLVASHIEDSTDNRLVNLQYAARDKRADAREYARVMAISGGNNGWAKLTMLQVHAIRSDLAVFVRAQANRLNMSESTVQRIVEGESWRHC